MKSRTHTRWAGLGLVVALFLPSGNDARAQTIGEARREIERLRYDRAETALVDIAKSADGEGKQEALYLLAGLKSSVSEAEIIYQEVIRIDPKSDWADRAQVELAKVQFALGNYNRALGMLEQSPACGHIDEACYFQGLSAMMLERYDDARGPLNRVRGGRYRPWAFLSLAEIDMKLNNRDAACREYQSMARAQITPTAMYRYAECLEKRGDISEAKRMFGEIVQRFGDTPEALAAAEKLDAFRTATERAAEPQREASAQPAMDKGFTLQFGAFHDRENAIKLLAALRPGLPGVRIDTEIVKNREVYRVRYGYFGTREDAERETNRLKNSIDEPSTIMTLP